MNVSANPARPAPESATQAAIADSVPPVGWRWAPVWILAFVALWPAPGYAETVMVLGALAAVARLLLVRFRGGTRLLSVQAWALTSVLFFAYWLPQAVAAVDAIDRADAFAEAAKDLRYLPFLWLAAAAVADPRGRRITFILAVWTADALIQAFGGVSPLFWSMEAAKQAMSGRPLCDPEDYAALDRLSGVFGPCNLKLGVILASLSPFGLFAAGARFGRLGWCIAAAAVGIAIMLAGSRASWITFGLVLTISGWRALGAKRLLAVFAFGGVVLLALTVFSPQVRERIERTASALTGDEAGMDAALSGRTRIWQAALCMIGEHPVNGVGPRGFRYAFPACDPEPERIAAWGLGPALHAHQLVLEVLSETGAIGLLLWLAGAAMARRAWQYAEPAARDAARPAMWALAVTVFPLNTHLAFYSTFWGGVTLLLAALYAGSLLGRESARDDEADAAAASRTANRPSVQS
jgi:O-antigen ligase